MATNFTHVKAFQFPNRGQAALYVRTNTYKAQK